MAEHQPEPQADYAVIGVGSLAEAIVIGLCERQTPAPRIVLSPRSRERAARLAERFPTVHVAPDNQSAVSSARTVLLCVRPQDAAEVMAPLEFSAEHRVVSVMAKLTLVEVARLSKPAWEVSRAIPAPAVSVRKGLTPVFPRGSAAESLFDGLGGSMVLGEERLLDAASTAAATVAAHFSFLRTASGWLADRGVAPTDADRFMASIFAGVGAELDGVSNLAPLAAAHTTPGGLNERVERSLRDAGVFATLTSSLDDLYASLPSSVSGRESQA